jgi:hypothetical protein
MMHRAIWIASLLSPLAPNPAWSQEAVGQVCVAPALPPAPGPKSLANPAGENRIKQYAVQIDSLPPVTVDPKAAKVILNIPSKEVHWVRIKGDGKLVESFKFKFSDFPSKRLCLFFNELYETWNLWDAKQARSICKCHD